MKSCGSMETMRKALTHYLGHRSPITWQYSVPKVPWDRGCIFLTEQCSKGQLPSQAIRKAFWIPRWLSLGWKDPKATEASTSGPSWDSVTDLEGGRGSAISCLLLGEPGSPWVVIGKRACGSWGLVGELRSPRGNKGGRLHVKGERRRQETSIKLFIS